MPAAIVALSPATDLTGSGESRTANLGVDRLFTKGVKGVNAYYAAGREKAFEQGTDVQVQVWKGMFHVFPVAGKFLPESARALRGIVEYIREKLKISTNP